MKCFESSSASNQRDLENDCSQSASSNSLLHISWCAVAEIHFFRWGAKPPKFPTKLSNFRQTPSFSPLLGQNFRKFVNFPWRWGGGGGRLPAPPRFPPLMVCQIFKPLNLLIIKPFVFLGVKKTKGVMKRLNHYSHFIEFISDCV